MKWNPIPRRLALTGGFSAVAAAGAFGGRWLGQSRMGARAATYLNREALFQDPEDPVIGNPLGALPLAEFFDYRCPYCHKMHPLLQRLLQEDHDIRFVAKEWPIFGGPSVTAARTALAANWQGKFAPVHDAFFEATGGLDDTKVRGAAEKAGMDMARLDHDLSTRSAKLDAMLGRVSVQARALALQGTPGFVIGSYLVPGALSYDDLLKVVSDARAKLKSAQDPHEEREAT
ncbi:MAG: DsbA family protein [Acetobacteraceae bacterium]|nr:DsbA family protein [Acetobacteraceae bacterium]